jgi:hypothetical protein
MARHLDANYLRAPAALSFSVMTDKQEPGSEGALEAASKLVDPDEDSLVFSVGCLYFGVNAKDINEWEQHVTEMLNRLPRVSDINISADISHGWKSIDGNVFPIEGIC